ncbi:MAG: cytochrome b/b6 domain-containing protein [Deltaproteobacteria bacterium]|nr:cytochrome b/b6 domain-containing protein [Deltaproteobacteria bacterium]
MRRGYLWHVEKIPEAGKYNPGQKLFFPAVAVFGALMVLTGLVMWFPGPGWYGLCPRRLRFR